MPYAPNFTASGPLNGPSIDAMAFLAVPNVLNRIISQAPIEFKLIEHVMKMGTMIPVQTEINVHREVGQFFPRTFVNSNATASNVYGTITSPTNITYYGNTVDVNGCSYIVLSDSSVQTVTGIAGGTQKRVPFKVSQTIQVAPGSQWVIYQIDMGFSAGPRLCIKPVGSPKTLASVIYNSGGLFGGNPLMITGNVLAEGGDIVEQQVVTPYESYNTQFQQVFGFYRETNVTKDLRMWSGVFQDKQLNMVVDLSRLASAQGFLAEVFATYLFGDGGTTKDWQNNDTTTTKGFMTIMDTEAVQMQRAAGVLNLDYFNDVSLTRIRMKQTPKCDVYYGVEAAGELAKFMSANYPAAAMNLDINNPDFKIESINMLNHMFRFVPSFLSYGFQNSNSVGQKYASQMIFAPNETGTYFDPAGEPQTYENSIQFLYRKYDNVVSTGGFTFPTANFYTSSTSGMLAQNPVGGNVSNKVYATGRFATKVFGPSKFINSVTA